MSPMASESVGILAEVARSSPTPERRLVDLVEVAVVAEDAE